MAATRRLPIVDGVQLLPPTGPHKIGVTVPPGGSNCAKCHFLRPPDRTGYHRCALVLWVMAPKSKGGGGGRAHIPRRNHGRWCCDGWEKR